jgi:tetratricopeptide (TPR) repeat protein
MYYLYDFLATCCIEAARPGRAVEALEYALGRFDELRLAIPTQAATGYYHLGIAYEMSGWNEKAIGQYETFLGLWKDADPGIPVVDEARGRLAGLRASS